jgi:hypothetical protein
MHTKIWMIIGTMVIAITFNAGKWQEDAADSIPFALLGSIESLHSAEAIDIEAADTAELVKATPEITLDPYHNALGAASDEEVYDALYNGQTLADFAAGHGQDPKRIIELQTAELAKQLDDRLVSGSLSPEAYLSHKAELSDIITRSAYGIV